MVSGFLPPAAGAGADDGTWAIAASGGVRRRRAKRSMVERETIGDLVGELRRPTMSALVSRDKTPDAANTAR